MKKSLLPRVAKDDSVPPAAIEELSGKEIAIIGMAVNVPGADSLDQFWSNLCRGEDWIREVPPGRMTAGGQSPNGENPPRGGYLPEVDTFDSLFFRIPPKEADLMDPYQRLFLETAWSAIEDAGYGGDQLKGSLTGVYVGSGHEHEYKQMLASTNPELLSSAAAGNLPPVIASRICFLLDLKGPSLVVDTACSSSLMAVHLACQALALRECDMAIAGGIQLILDPSAPRPKIGIESPTSTLRAFDEDADGTVRGEGIGAVLLKPLSRAIADNDPVYAVIKSSVSNQDGKSIGITSPNRAAQEQLLISAWDRAGIHPSTLSYIETHGTGTAIGDPIEIHAIQNAFRTYTDSLQFCGIGSVKPNIGHLYHAAGIVGLIKSALAMHREQLPPSIHFERPNSRIDFVQSPVYVNSSLAEWKRSEEVRRCGISSFGMSGTNCHVILEEAGAGIRTQPSIIEEGLPALLTLSARSLSSLRALLEKYRIFLLSAEPQLFRDICYTTNIGRGRYEYRLAIVARNPKELRDSLAALRYETFSCTCGKLEEGIWFGGPEAQADSDRDEMPDGQLEHSGNDLWEQAAWQFAYGLKVDWGALHAGQARRIVSAPTYAFDKHKHWFPCSKENQGNDAVDHRAENKGGDQEVETSEAQTKYSYAVTETVRGIIADISGYSQEALGSSRSFMELGMDSILLVNVRHAIKDRFGIDIPLRLFFEEVSTVADVGQYIVSQAEELPIPDVISEMVEDKAKQEAAIALAADVHPDLEPSKELSYTPSLGLEGIVHKQLDLMARQLSMLQNGSAEMSQPAPASSLEVIVKNAAKTGVAHNRATLTPVNARPQDRPYVPYQKLATAAKSGFTPSQQQFIDEFIVRYTEKTSKSQRHTQAFRGVVANNRNVAGFRPYWKDIVYQIVADSADGSTLRDIDGNEYIDLTMGFGVNLFGHNVPFINEAVDEALQKGMCIGPINAVAGEVASALRDLTGMERAAFFNSGTEAIMVAARLARAATGKAKIAVFSGSYHGTFDGVLAMSAGVEGAGTPIAPGIPRGMIDEVIVLNYDHPESLQIIERRAGELAAVLVEPVQSRKPDVQPASFLKKLRALTAAHGIALIFDEVITGFRIHPGGAQAWFGIEADMAVYGKVIGGGLPIGIVAGKPDYLDGIDGGMWSFGDASFPPHEERRTFVAGTFCQHPLAMNAALAVLQQLQAVGPALQEDLNEKTAILADTLNAYFEEEQLPLQIVRFGSLFRFVQKTDLELLYYLLIDKGIYIWEGRNCFLSTAHSMEDIERIVGAVKASVEELRHAGFLPFSPSPSPGSGRSQLEGSAAATSESIPLTEEQRQLWFVSRMDADKSVAYSESAVLRLHGIVNTERLQAAIHDVIRRHGMLRTRFAEDGSLQHTEPFDIMDYRYSLYEAVVEKSASSLSEPLLLGTDNGFDLTTGPLIRFGLLHVSAEEHLFIVQAHHIIADGWSFIRILEEISGYYTDGESFRVPEPARFSDFAAWQRNLPAKELQQARAFWADRLSVSVPKMNFPAANGLGDHPVPPGMRLTKTVDSRVTTELRAYGRKHGTSLFMLMLGAYNMLLSRLSGQKEVTVGIPVSGQLQMGATHLVGQCVNLLPFSSRIPVAVNAKDYIVQMKRDLLELLDHQRCSYADIVQALGMEGKPVFPPSIQTIFNFDKPPAFRFGECETKLEPSSAVAFKYPLSLNVLELEQELVLEWDVGSGLCGEEEAESWLEAYCKLLEDMVSSNGTELRLFSKSEIHAAQRPFWAENPEVLYNEHETGLVVDNEGLPCLPGVPGRLYWKSEGDAVEIRPTDMAAVMGADGRLHLLGQLERLVTIAGFHVHLDQIEAALHRVQEGPKVAITLESDEQGRGNLVAYYESEDGQGPSERQRREEAAKVLPEPLIPLQWINVSGVFPKNEQGVDYNLLAARYGRTTRSTVAPVTPIQVQIHRLWQETLKREDIGISDHFLAIGGNSLAATVIAAKLQGELGRKVPLSLLFQCKTIEELAEALDRAPHAESVTIPQAVAAECYPQSAEQRAIFAVERMGGAGLAYNVTGLIKVEGTLNLEQLHWAANKLVERHECLRTSFYLEENEPVQKVLNEASIEIPVHLVARIENEETMLSFVRPFNLENGPLLRIEVWREQAVAGQQYLLMDMHHMIADGLSANLLFDELIRLYDGQHLPDAALHLKDYTQWQLGRIGSGYLRESEKYWSALLKGDLPRLEWTTDYPRPAVRCLEGDRYSFPLDQASFKRIREYASVHGITLYSYVLAAFYVLLSKYAGQDDIIVGTSVSGRLYPDIEHVPGMFVHTIPLRNRVTEDKLFSGLVHDIQANSLEAFEHQEYPLERLFARLQLDRDMSRNPLFDVTYIYQHEALKPEAQQGGEALFTAVECKSRSAKFDLTLEAVEAPEEITLCLEYSTELFHRASIQAMAGHLLTILDTVAANPDLLLSEIGLLSPAEKAELQYGFNATAAEYPSDLPVFRLFEEQVLRTPEAVAVSCEQVQLTYAELNAQANRISALLRDKGIQTEAAVGLVMQRSPELIAAILGIWKAGGCYVPIDPTYPKERITYILSDCGAQCVISDAEYEELAGFNGTLINISEGIMEPHLPLDNPMPGAGPDHLAYIIYTSGSTGKPKGVMVEHKGLTHYIWWANRMYIRGDKLSFPLYSSISFDLTVTSMFAPLLSGSRIIVYPGSVETALEQIIEEGEADIIKLTPSHLKLLHLYNTDRSRLRRFIVGGEAFETSAAAEIAERFGPDTEIYNEYGPTETVVGCMIQRYEPGDTRNQVPIGLPIDNIRLYIADSKGELQAKHVPGELCIAGAGVARGYYNRTELTQEKFVSGWFGESGKVYRTGDLVRWMPEGGMQYLGRFDDQVKLRGYRIETGEIQNLLLDYPHISEAAVLVKAEANGEKRLCAYYTSKQQLEAEQLEVYLSAQLPAYMLPSVYIQLDRLPLSANGKVDYKRLPNAEEAKRRQELKQEKEQEKDSLLPEYSIEAELLEVWRDILRAPDARSDERFIKRGGDSIKAIQIAAQLKKRGIHLEVADILRGQTVQKIARLAVRLDKRTNVAETPPLEGEVPLAPIQQWFFEQNFTAMHHWNQSVSLIGTIRLDEEHVKQTIDQLVRYHDALRMTFAETTEGIQPYCQKGDMPAFAFRIVDQAKMEEELVAVREQAVEDMHRSINLDHGPLVQVALIRGADEDELIFVIHHLIIDAVSWRILLDDFYDIYSGLIQGVKPNLPDKTDSYKDYSQMMHDYATNGLWNQEMKYWEKRSSLPASPLTKDRDCGNGTVQEATLSSLHFTKSATSSLLKAATEHCQADTATMLLSALGHAMNVKGVTDGIWINLEGHGRENLNGQHDYSRTVGWFTSHYPVYLDVSAAETPGRYTTLLYQDIQRIPHRGAGYNALKYKIPEGNAAGSSALSIKPEISFNYIGEMEDQRYRALFRLAELPMHGTESPESERPFALSFNALLSDGRLIVELEYNEQQIREETIQQLLQGFQLGLEKVLSSQGEPSLSVLALVDSDLVPASEVVTLLSNMPFEIGKVYPLSPMQESILFHYLRYPDSEAYFEQCVIYLKGGLDPESLRLCFQRVLDRHDILRTTFAVQGLERPLQAVANAWSLPFRYEDWTTLEYVDVSDKLHFFLTQDRRDRFDLFGGIPLRVSLIRTDAEDYCLVWSFHHILLDGWSVGLILHELFSLYSVSEPGKQPSMQPASLYGEYIKWIEHKDPSAAETYWKSYLSGYRNKSLLPKEDAASGNYNPGELSRVLSEELRLGLMKLSEEQGVTLNILFQAAWATVLQKLNEADDVVFGAVVSGRSPEVKDIDAMIGLFINTVPVRVKAGAFTFLELAQQLQMEMLDKEPYAYLPLSAIQSAGGGAGLDHVLVFENYPLDLNLPPGLNIVNYDWNESTNYDFNLIVEPHEEYLIRFVYNQAVFSEEELQDWLASLLAVLGEIVGNSEVPLHEITLEEAGEDPDEDESRIEFHF